jgi:hypothetical protein
MRRLAIEHLGDGPPCSRGQSRDEAQRVNPFVARSGYDGSGVASESSAKRDPLASKTNESDKSCAHREGVPGAPFG